MESNSVDQGVLKYIDDGKSTGGKPFKKLKLESGKVYFCWKLEQMSGINKNDTVKITHDGAEYPKTIEITKIKASGGGGGRSGPMDDTTRDSIESQVALKCATELISKALEVKHMVFPENSDLETIAKILGNTVRRVAVELKAGLITGFNVDTPAQPPVDDEVPPPEDDDIPF
jgi:hypothetical protein